MPAEIIRVRDTDQNSRANQSAYCSSGGLVGSIGSGENEQKDRKYGLGNTSVSMGHDNADLMRLIASSIAVRKLSIAEDRMKILRKVHEENSLTESIQCDVQVQKSDDDEQKRQRSTSENVEQDEEENKENDDETLSPEEEAAARAAVRKNMEHQRPGLPRRSIQYDNPELTRLINSNAATKRGSITGRKGSFCDERFSYRTALEKLMPSYVINEYQTEESFEQRRGSDSTTVSSEIEQPESENGYDVDRLSSVADSICKIFQHPSTGKIHVKKFLNAITETGIRMTDPRLNDSMHKLKHVLRRMGTDFDSSNTCLLDAEEFKNAICKDVMFIKRVLKTSFVIPEWQEFCRHVFALYSSCKRNNAGRVSDFIPQLADYNPELWAVSVCSVDGQRFSAGDADVSFCLQACCRVLNYAIALNDHGAETVHSYVGQEPSGRDTRELVLDENKKPHNPMINAGAIVVTSLVKDTCKHMADRFEAIYSMYQKMAGKEYMGFSNTSYLSERQISYRNFALGYFLRENKCFPENAKLEETLELLLQLYSIDVTCESLSIIAATLANGGICPTTGEYVIGSHCVRDVLSLMYSCGLNDYSGKFAFHVGLPARSSVSGAIMLVVPNVMGVCLWSPPLDQHQNSVRGVQFCMDLVKIFNFHMYDNLRFTQRKLDPRRMQVETKTQQVVLTLFSAANGDITALRRFLLQGVDLTLADYDGRTPLHIAAAEGHMHCVKFLLQKARVSSRPLDRWGNTPADDARNHDFYEIADYLEKWHTVAASRPRTSVGELLLHRIKQGHAPRSIAETMYTEDSPYMSDYESGENMSIVESEIAILGARSM